MQSIDLAIVGAGPAGMAAAIAAREIGVDVAVLDEQAEPGGQIYRGVERAAARPGALEILGADYAAGAALVGAFRASGARYLPRASVWRIDAERRVYFTAPGGGDAFAAKHVLIATGAIERPMPFPGWTLPGVMTCGAAQIVLKSAALVPAGRVYLAGGGPLVLLLAAQLTRAGVPVAAILNTLPVANLWPALARLPAFLRAPGYFGKGLGMLAELRRAGVRIVRGVSELRAHGSDRLQAVEYRTGAGAQRESADLLLVHQGVVPNANLALATRCEHRWDDAQRCFRPVCDDWGDSSIDGITIAGDGAGIAGAQAAESAGRLAALAIGCKLGRIDARERDRRAVQVRAGLARHLRARGFLDALYRPPQRAVAPADDVLACRCEEVTAGEIRRLAQGGCPGPNQMKAFVRAGMGPCQGRLCGLTVTEIIAAARRVPQQEVGYYRIRSPVRPLTLGELAGME
ncbi:MAG TPA: NAD(P)/FAD-dependent oxidoreductase [Burkholderiales bacterium]|nr:NAD(P)/FAD-dependent oxidoreductase [Burkholderiales bacterium]